MAIQGKFVVDNKPLSPLFMFGVGSFPAFSGEDIYLNRGGCSKIPDKGPIPAGRYWIVDRPTGGWGSQMIARVKDLRNSFSGPPSHRDEWFALFFDDGQIDDYMWVEGVKRGNFRLHPKAGQGISKGCITLQSYSDFQIVRQALMQTTTVPAGNSGLQAYGWIEVITDGDTCP
jgi:type VI secretion system (T6SS) effector TldE1-like protein